MARKPRKRKPATPQPNGIVAVLAELQPAKSAEIADRIGADQLLVRAQLMALEKAGEVHRIGQTRGTRWIVGPANGVMAPAAHATEGDATSIDRRGPKEQRLDAFRSVLGTIPDAEVADRAGVSQRTVQNYRKRHQIGGFTGRGPVTRGRATEPAPLTAGATVWKVDIATDKGTTSLFVVGDDLVSASRNAQLGLASGGIHGDIVALSLIGAML
jgi:hypothetical protein